MGFGDPAPALHDAGKVREFETGATRDQDGEKLEFEGFLSPLVLMRYAEYMHEHRFQSDGELRAADNWQKGIPRDSYMSSGWRHFMDWWLCHRDLEDLAREDLEKALCAVIFNASGYLHELLKERRSAVTENVSEHLTTCIVKGCTHTAHRPGGVFDSRDDDGSEWTEDGVTTRVCQDPNCEMCLPAPGTSRLAQLVSPELRAARLYAPDA